MDLSILVMFAAFGLLIAIEVPIAFALAGSALLYLVLNPVVPPIIVVQRMAPGIDSFPLLAVPLFILYNVTSFEPAYNPNGKWLGPGLTGDDQALCGNREITFNGDPDQTNFEGPCDKSGSRQYWCAMDLLP